MGKRGAAASIKCARARPITSAAAASDHKKDLIAITEKLLSAIGSGDFATYSSLCHDESTCIEPETLGQIVHGLDFHKHYFDLPSDPSNPPAPSNITLCDVNVRVCPKGVMGFVTYNRLGQSGVTSSLAQETR